MNIINMKMIKKINNIKIRINNPKIMNNKVPLIFNYKNKD
jgi:hypothetical protein